MNRLFSLYILLNVSCALQAQPPYQKLYDNGAEFAQALGITSTSDGGNAFVGIINIPGQPSQVNITKLLCNGDVQWSRLLGPSSTVDNIFPEVKSDKEGRIWFTSNIGSWNNYDGIIGSLSPSGDLIKAVRLGTSGRNDQVYGLALGGDYSVYVTGTTNSWGSDKNGNPAYGDVFVARLDSNLNMVWARTIGNKDAIDTGYDLVLDSDGNPNVTGRFIVDGTFFSFLLKLDAEGNIILFKGYGESGVPHRTYGYGIETTNDGNVLLTGSTTINKVDHTSIPDVFLIKTDKDGNSIFETIFIPSTGSDNSESGSSIIEMKDGRYAIGVPTMSFTQFTQGFIPNKNAVFVTDLNGSLSEARIYNKGASHYTRLELRNPSFVLSNFSNFYSQPNPGAGPFRPLIIVTDESIQSGCEEVDVTSSLSQVKEVWKVQNIQYNLDTQFILSPYSAINLFGFAFVETRCQTADNLTASFTLPPSICTDELLQLIAETTGEIINLEWDLGDGTMFSGVEDTSYVYNEPGNYLVSLRVQSFCNEVYVEQNITVYERPIIERDTFICSGDSLFLEGAFQKVEGTYTDNVPGPVCDTVIITGLYFKRCDCGIEFPNVFTPNGDQNNDDFGPYIACDLDIRKYQIQIYNRFGTLVHESDDPAKRWDGKYKGTDQPADVYAWVVTANYLLEGKEVMHTRRGDITLVR